MKRLTLFILSGVMMLNFCGCFAVVAGVAGGAGTAVWLSGKLTQEFHAPYHRTIDATTAALQSMNLQVTRETWGDNVSQIKAIYSDGREMWIDIIREEAHSTKVDVRVGMGDKEAAARVLRRIQDSL